MSCTVLCCHVFLFCLQAACNSSPGSLKVFHSLSLNISGFILYFNISLYLSLIKFVEQVQDKRCDKTKNTTADELYVKVTSLRNRKESSKDPGGASGPAADPSAAHQSIIRKGFRRRMAVKKLFFKKGIGAKRLRYAKLHKNCAKNLWQQIL